jgi:hypothetical protein
MTGEDWSLSGASTFGTIGVQAGRLAINGPIAATGGTTVEAGGVLGGSGTGHFGGVSYLGNGAATLFQTDTTVSLIALAGTGPAASAFAGTQTRLDCLEGLAAEQIAGLSGCHGACLLGQGAQDRHLWTRGFGRFYQEDAADGNQAYSYRDAGGALGGDVAVSEGLRLAPAWAMRTRR